MKDDSSMTEAQRGLRANVIGVLKFISSRQAQLKLKREAPFVDVVGEVFCMWADDIYVFAARDSFRGAFCAAELSAIAVFDEALEAIADAVIEKKPSLNEFLVMPEWQRLAEAARKALQAFEVSRSDLE